MNKLIRDISFSTVCYFCLIFFLSIPLIVLVYFFFVGPGPMWAHIVEHLLGKYIVNTFVLLLGTLLLASFLGVSLAYIMSFYELCLAKYFHFLLILPLAIPSYIMAFLAVHLAEKINLDIMNRAGLMLVLSLSLYPYIYYLSKRSFDRLSQEQMDLAFLLGKSKYKIFKDLVLGGSRPAIISGMLLVSMEVLSDYGSAKYFGVHTFTTGIFRTWFSLEDSQTALYLSLVLLFIVLISIFLEQFFRGTKHYNSNGMKRDKKEKPSGVNLLIYPYLILVIVISFLLPIFQLLIWTKEENFNFEFLKLSLESFSLGMISALLITLVAIFIIKFKNWNQWKAINFLTTPSTAGYAIPGAIIAIAISIIALKIDQLSHSLPLFLYGSFFVLIYAYLFRFIAVAYHPLNASYDNLSSSYFSVSDLLGHSKWICFRKIEWPILKSEIIGVFILVFIEIIKELPISLILKPYSINTLAINAYQYASDEMVEQAALPSLLIIFLTITVFIYFFAINKDLK